MGYATKRYKRLILRNDRSQNCRALQNVSPQSNTASKYPRCTPAVEVGQSFYIGQMTHAKIPKDTFILV